MKKLFTLAFFVSLPFSAALPRAAAGPLEDSRMESGVMFGEFDFKGGEAPGAGGAVLAENSGGSRKALAVTACAGNKHLSSAVPEPEAVPYLAEDEGPKWDPDALIWLLSGGRYGSKYKRIGDEWGFMAGPMLAIYPAGFLASAFNLPGYLGIAITLIGGFLLVSPVTRRVGSKIGALMDFISWKLS